MKRHSYPAGRGNLQHHRKNVVDANRPIYILVEAEVMKLSLSHEVGDFHGSSVASSFVMNEKWMIFEMQGKGVLDAMGIVTIRGRPVPARRDAGERRHRTIADKVTRYES